MLKSEPTRQTTRFSRKRIAIETTIVACVVGLSIVAGLTASGSQSEPSVAQPSPALVEAYRATLDAAE